MNILMILNQSFPGDIRVEKECRALSGRGHRVVVTSIGETRGNYEFAEIARLRTNNVPKFLVRSLKGFPILIRRVTEAIGDFVPEAIHVHDLQWATLGYKLSLMFRAKLVLDFHENYPAALKARRSAKRSLLGRIGYTISSNTKSWKKFELKMVNRADRVIVVVPEAFERFVDVEVDLSKFEIVSNTENPKDWEPASYDGGVDKFSISYIGGIGAHRGIETLINAIKFVNSENVVLQIVGMTGKNLYEKSIRQLVEESKDQARIILRKWVNFEEVKEVIRTSTLCTVPHNRFEHTETTIPHKLFQYMACSVPVLVSDVRPLRRVVENANCGFIFEANNAKSCADRIKEALNCSVEHLRELGQNGRRAVEIDFNWKEDAARLVKLYDQLDNKTL